MDRISDTGVLIVGASAAGLLAANLLGALGVETLLVERHEDVDAAPATVRLGAGGWRACQAAGLGAGVGALALCGLGERLLGQAGQVLRRVAPAIGPEGHPRLCSIAKPDLLRLLRGGLGRYPAVTSQFHTRLIDFSEAGERITATLLGPDGNYRQVRARLLLGCDGRNSTVREQLGIDLAGARLEQRWLVAETAGDSDDGRYLRLVADPRQPAAMLPGPRSTRRYAFLLRPGPTHPGERQDALAGDAALAALLAPWNHGEGSVIGRSVEPEQAQLAERLRRGRALLLGDAAHLLPAFGCPAIDEDLLDALNLAWKAAMVANEEAGLRLLDSYDAERRPQLRAVIAHGVRLTKLATTADLRRVRLRDRLMPLAGRQRPFAAAAPGRLGAGLFVDDHAPNDRSLVGRALPQPRMLASDGRVVPLDEALGGGFALLRFGASPAVGCLTHPLWGRLAPRLVTLLPADRTPRRSSLNEAVVADRSGTFADAARYHRGQFLLVRPDRRVAGAFEPQEAAAFAETVRRLLA